MIHVLKVRNIGSSWPSHMAHFLVTVTGHGAPFLVHVTNLKFPINIRSVSVTETILWFPWPTWLVKQKIGWSWRLFSGSCDQPDWLLYDAFILSVYVSVQNVTAQLNFSRMQRPLLCNGPTNITFDYHGYTKYCEIVTKPNQGWLT